MRKLMQKIGAVLAVVLLITPVAEAVPAGFPTEEVNNYEGLHAYFNFAPYTTAQFEQQRTMPSGRVLRSKGYFEYRRGVGMMWRTDLPARTAMVISRDWMVVYGSRGQELRRTALEGSPAARYTTVFLDGAKPDNLDALSRAFRVTCRVEGERLVLGFQALREGMDLRWLMVDVVGGNVNRVAYSSGRQGDTVILFKGVKNGEKVPTAPFRLLTR